MGKLTDFQIADFRSRHPIETSAIGTYALIVKDQGRLIDVFKIGDQLAYIEISAGALPSFADMAEGEIRPLLPNKGTVKEATIAAILIGAIEHPVFSTEVLEKTAAVVGNVAGKSLEAIGKGLAPVSEGLGRGLLSLKLFGVPLVLLVAVGGTLYFVAVSQIEKKLL